MLKTKRPIAASATETPWPQRPLLPIKTAAELLGVSRSSVYRLEAAGKLSFGKVSGKTVVRTESLLKFLQNVEDWTPSAQGQAGRKAAVTRAQEAWR